MSLAARQVMGEAAGRWLLVRTIRMAHRAKPKDPPERMETWLAGLTGLGYETYYPLVRELRPVPQRELSRARRALGIMRPRMVPFLPYVVFLRGQGRGRLLDHPGVIDVVRVGTEPALISDALVRKLKLREATIEDGIPAETLAAYVFEPGDEVRVVNGPFATFNAIVEERARLTLSDIDAEVRLKLTVDIFGRPTSIDLPADHVCKL